MIALALFVFELGVVFTALGTAMLFLHWLDEFRATLKTKRMRNLNLSWQSSATARNQDI